MPFLLAQSMRVARSHCKQRNMATFVQSADRRRERLAAILALVHARPRALYLQLGCTVDRTTARTRRTIRPPHRPETAADGVFVAEIGFGRFSSLWARWCPTQRRSA